LVKRLALSTVDEALENERTIPDSSQSAWRNRQVVADEIELREPRLPRKIRLARVGHSDLASLDREHLGGFFLPHKNRLTLAASTLAADCADDADGPLSPRWKPRVQSGAAHPRHPRNPRLKTLSLRILRIFVG